MWLSTSSPLVSSVTRSGQIRATHLSMLRCTLCMFTKEMQGSKPETASCYRCPSTSTIAILICVVDTIAFACIQPKSHHCLAMHTHNIQRLSARHICSDGLNSKWQQWLLLKIADGNGKDKELLNLIRRSCPQW